VIAAVLLSVDKAHLALTALRLVFDWAEAERNRVERKRASVAYEDRFRALEQQLEDMKGKRKKKR
jgi:hypothetical protein